MKRLLRKAHSTISILGFKDGVLFLFYLSLYRLFRTSLEDFAYKMFYRKHRIMLGFIKRLSEHEAVEAEPARKQDIDENTVWVFWYQGESSMPEIVRMCIESVRRHSAGYRVVLLHKDNIAEWTDLPIMDKVGRSMTYTNFSDYLRLSLLTAYGGIWIDATMFVTRDIKPQVDAFDFFTIRNERERLYCISEYRWSVSFIKCHKHDSFISYTCALFRRYCSIYDTLFEYALMDYIFAYLAEEQGFKEKIEAVPLNNPRTYKNCLYDILGEQFDADEYEDLLKNTWLHKLAHYKTFPTEADGHLTFYGKLKGQTQSSH